MRLLQDFNLKNVCIDSNRNVSDHENLQAGYSLPSKKHILLPIDIIFQLFEHFYR